MDAKKAKQLGYTNHAKMYGFKGFANLADDAYNTFKAKYIITDLIVECLIYIEILIPNDDGFKILLGAELIDSQDDFKDFQKKYYRKNLLYTISAFVLICVAVFYVLMCKGRL